MGYLAHSQGAGFGAAISLMEFEEFSFWWNQHIKIIKEIQERQRKE